MRESRTADANWTLLYSTLGYEAQGAKYAFLRPTFPDGALPPSPLGWALYRESGEEVLRGPFRHAEPAEGLSMLVADFGSWVELGRYSLRALPAADFDGEEGHVLATLAFEIGHDLCFRRTFGGMVLDGAKARQAPSSLGGGYYDSNTGFGDVGEHAVYAVGLMHVLASRGQSLLPLERAQLVWAIDRAIDYVSALVDSKTGAIAHQDRRRPRAPAFVPAADTAAGLWALATYSDVFRGESAARARQACHLALAAEAWLQTVVPERYPPSLEATANAAFWWHSGDPRFLERALDAVETELAGLEGIGDHPAPEVMVPRFEGLYMLQQRVSRDARVGGLLRRVRDLVEPLSGEAPSVLLARGPCDAPWLRNQASTAYRLSTEHGLIISTAIDALYLARLLRGASLVRVGTEGLAWICGLHRGGPGNIVENPPSAAPIESAALIHGLDARRVVSKAPWWWPSGAMGARVDPLLRLAGLRGGSVESPPAAFMSVLSGGDGLQAPWDQSGATSLKLDGLWLYAATMQGDHFGQRSA